jgi:thioredoxin 1
MKITKKKLFIGITIAIVALFAGQMFLNHYSKPALPESGNFKKVANEREFKTILDKAGTKLIAFDLYADWCFPCRMLHPTLEALAGKYNGKIDFYCINVDDNPGIAAMFGTNGIPYVVFVKDQKAIASIVGVNPSESYEKVIEANSVTDNGSSNKNNNPL